MVYQRGAHQRSTGDGLSFRPGDSKVGGYPTACVKGWHRSRALIHQPELIILDEPTSGLDLRYEGCRELIRHLGGKEKRYFLSSHLLHEVELVCNRAAIMRKGRVGYRGP
jgi:ABC-type Na+ transport system ATPase subunit NatA